MKKTIGIIATLDTKGREANYLQTYIQNLGDEALLIDTGVMGTPTVEPDISRDRVAEAGDSSLDELQHIAKREFTSSVMAKGTIRIVAGLLAENKMHAIIGLGGTQGTTLATKVMRALPYGFPKVMVSTMASGNVAPWVDIKDITMIFSVADLLGLNSLTCNILANAAAAVCGMAQVKVEVKSSGKPLIAVTTVGITMKGAIKAVEVLEQAGYDTIVFHAVGSGGRAMEAMMKEGIIHGVLDFSIIEVSNEMYHALLAGGPDRLTVAGKLNLPQVICPGAVEVLVFNEPETVPAPYKDRTLIRHSAQITDVRLDKQEMMEVGREVARRLQFTQRETFFLIPTAGFDSYAVEGQGFHDPEADAAFISELRAHVPHHVKILERNIPIENPAFATEAAELLISLIRQSCRMPR